MTPSPAPEPVPDERLREILATYVEDDRSEFRAIVSELLADRARRTDNGVRVRELEWRDGYADAPGPRRQFAHTGLGVFFVLYQESGAWHLERRDGGVTHSVWPTEKEAKAFTQTKWDELVLSAFTPAPAAESEKLREALDNALAEIVATREACSLVRRQDYFDVPTPILVEAQIEAERWRTLNDLSDAIGGKLPVIDGVLKRFRSALKDTNNAQ